MLNPEWLRYFVALAETLNYHAAAQRLHITPQALSHAISQLEEHFKVRLVERTKVVKGLTPAGEALRTEAKAALAGLVNVEVVMSDWRDERPRGPVTVASVGLVQNYLLPGFLEGFLATHPDVVPRLHLMQQADVERWVASGEVDFGLILAPPAHADLDWREGLRTPYVVVGRPGPVQPWDAFGYIGPRLFRQAIDAPLDGWPAKFPRRIVAEVELLDTALNLAEAGVGATYVPELAARDRIGQGRLAVVATPPAPFEDVLYVVWRRGVKQGLATRTMIAALEIYLAALPG